MLNPCNTKAFRENPLICADQFIFMKSRLPVLFCIFLGLLGCSKDNNTVNPSIAIKSYSDHVPANGIFNAVLTFSQKNGSLSGDSLVVIRHRLNQTPIPVGEEKPDTFSTYLPIMPSTDKADFSLSLDWFNLTYGINSENDTFVFRFVV